MVQVQEVKQIKQGWECPKCGRVYAPHVDMCQYCGDNSVTITTTCGSDTFAVYDHQKGGKLNNAYSVSP